MGQINPGLIVAGRYRLLRKLGQGGMGTVWSARNELIDREVAIKMMRPEAAANPVSLQRFFTEAKASGRLRHPNITEIFDLGQAEDGSPFLVLELLTGEPLDSILRRVPNLAPVQVLLLAKAIASGLNVAHAKGIIHRDLKPANIYFHRDPITLDVIPKILDFGISKVTGPEAIDYNATHTGTVVGSPTYMSPEQARGVNDIDARADIWSVGVLMYKSLTGRAPFNAANYNALMVAIMTEPHPPVTRWIPTIPKVVSDIIDDCLRKERNERIQSAKALLARIDSALLSLNAERAKLELPSDVDDDDMPTIARGDRNDLLQLVTAHSNSALPAPASATPPPVVEPSAPSAPQVVPPVQVLPPVQLAVPATPASTAAPASAAAPPVADPFAPAPLFQTTSQSPASQVDDDPIAAAKRKTRKQLLVIALCGLATFLTVVGVAVVVTRSFGTTGEKASAGEVDEPETPSSKKTDEKKTAGEKPDEASSDKTEKASKTDDDLEDVPSKAVASSEPTTTAPTAVPTPTGTTATTAATPTVTAAPAPTPKPTATAAPKPTATAAPAPTPKPAAPKPTTTTKKPTSVVGPGF